ncbi:MAG TPA: hypothetical protein VMF65_05600 [Acidimicrobiales bacterium]|nr:hypothetical protein [Acidimicrobiales bacterium]
MDRLRLKECLEAAGVPEDRYLLVGLDPPRALREGACVVRPNQRAWEVLIWEPARLAALLTFLNEDQACDYALDVLTTAAKPPVGAVDLTADAGPGIEPAPAAVETVARLTPLPSSGKTPLTL